MSTQWYAWTGPTGAQARLCANCWNYWRKYGGFKTPNKLSKKTCFFYNCSAIEFFLCNRSYICFRFSVDTDVDLIKKPKIGSSPEETMTTPPAPIATPTATATATATSTAVVSEPPGS